MTLIILLVAVFHSSLVYAESYSKLIERLFLISRLFSFVFHFEDSFFVVSLEFLRKLIELLLLFLFFSFHLNPKFYAMCKLKTTIYDPFSDLLFEKLLCY